MDGLFFHHSFCMVAHEEPELSCLIDKRGWPVLQEFDCITHSNNFELWKVCKGKEQGVYDKDLNMIIPMTEASINLYDDEICMRMPDHTMRKYDLKGNLTTHVASEEIVETIDENYRPKAIARQRAYSAGKYYEGLMTRDGRIITPPLYEDIEAIDTDLYLCTVSNNDKVIINGRGEVVK